MDEKWRSSLASPELKANLGANTGYRQRYDIVGLAEEFSRALPSELNFTNSFKNWARAKKFVFRITPAIEVCI